MHRTRPSGKKTVNAKVPPTAAGIRARLVLFPARVGKLLAASPRVRDATRPVTREHGHSRRQWWKGCSPCTTHAHVLLNTCARVLFTNLPFTRDRLFYSFSLLFVVPSVTHPLELTNTPRCRRNSSYSSNKIITLTKSSLSVYTYALD